MFLKPATTTTNFSDVEKLFLVCRFLHFSNSRLIDSRLVKIDNNKLTLTVCDERILMNISLSSNPTTVGDGNWWKLLEFIVCHYPAFHWSLCGGNHNEISLGYNCCKLFLSEKLHELVTTIQSALNYCKYSHRKRGFSFNCFLTFSFDI